MFWGARDPSVNPGYANSFHKVDLLVKSFLTPLIALNNLNLVYSIQVEEEVVG